MPISRTNARFELPRREFFCPELAWLEFLCLEFLCPEFLRREFPRSAFHRGEPHCSGLSGWGIRSAQIPKVMP